MIKKVLILGISCASLLASETQYGHGTYSLEGGFMGFGAKMSTDIDSYSLVEQHSNIFGSNFYYGYNVTWYDSKVIKQAQKFFDTQVNQASSLINGYMPGGLQNGTKILMAPLKYDYQGLDAQVKLGYDILHKSEHNFLGVNAILGISFPYINTHSSSSNSQLVGVAKKAFKASKTEFETYRLGIGLEGQKSLNDFFTIYASTGIAKQFGKIKNGYAKADFNAHGTYTYLDAGLRFDFTNYKKDLFDIYTISPRLYLKAGYRYTQWKYNNIGIDVSGLSLKFNKGDMKMSTSVGYVSIGYNF